MKRNVLGVVAALSVTLCVGIGSTALVGCGSHKASKVDDLALPVAEIPAQNFAKRWSVDVTPSKGQKIVGFYESGTYLFAIDSQNFSTVINKETGAVVGVHEVRTAIDLMAPFTNGKLFAYPAGTEIYFFNAEGKQVNVLDTKSALRSTGAFSDNAAYLGTTGMNGSRLRSVDLSRKYGTTKWEFLTDGALIAAPVYYDQLVYCATEKGRVYAVDESKNNAWSVEKGYYDAGPVTADLAIDDAGLYVASTDSKLVAIDRRTGRTKWQYFAGYPLNLAPIATVDTIYLPIRNQGLAAISKTDMSFNRPAKWLSRESTDFLADDGTYTYVRLKGNAIAALDRNTGAVVFRSGRTDMDFFLPNKTKEGTIYAATKSGYVVAITPVTKPGTMGEMMFSK